MEINKFKHNDVNEDGTCLTGGAVEIGGSVRFSDKEGGCGSMGCDCSPGHWVCIIFPRTEDGNVNGVSINFDNKIQLIKFIENMKAAAEEYRSQPHSI